VSASRFAYPALVIVLLVALRVTIGWYFFESGRSKNLDRDFSSARFLSQATGPLAGFYKAGLPDYHDFSRQMDRPLEDEPNPHPPGSKSWEEHAARPYAAWQNTIVIDLGYTKQQAVEHFSFDEQQDQNASKIFAYHEGRLQNYFSGSAADLAAYRHELARLARWRSADSARDVPYEADRIAAKERELQGTAREFRSAVQKIEDDYRSELTALATAEQRAQQGDLPRAANPLAGLDRFIMVSHFLIGGCMVVGLLSRLASLGGGLFLVTVIVSQPPWIVGYSTIGYQIVMMFCCLLLAATPSGRWCGLDYFVHKIWVDNGSATRSAKSGVETVTS
jgi:uncharacterized membrane protein YphA (DoxX/SURF4 family)